MQNLLVAGASGYIGSFFKEYFETTKTQGNVYTSSRSDFSTIDWRKNDTEIIADLNSLDISVVLNCMGNANVDTCEFDERINLTANVESVNRLLNILQNLQRKPLLIHLSSIYVFGSNQHKIACVETDLPDPANKYGKAKLLAENEIVNIYPNFIIIRLPLMVGNTRHPDDIVKKMQGLINKDSHLRGDQTYKQIRYPTSVYDLAEFLLKEIIDKLDEQGYVQKILHFSSTLGVSKKDILFHLALMNNIKSPLYNELESNVAFRPYDLKLGTIFPEIEKYISIFKIDDFLKINKEEK